MIRRVPQGMLQCAQYWGIAALDATTLTPAQEAAVEEQLTAIMRSIGGRNQYHPDVWAFANIAEAR